MDPWSALLYVVQNGLHNGMSVRRMAETAMKATSSIIVRLAFILCIGVCFGAAWGCGPRPASQIPSVPPPTLNPPLQSARVPAATNLPPDVSPPVSTAAAAAVDCGLFPDHGESTEAISTVGLAERVDPAHAPHPSNESERMLFRQLYETLIRADCQGNAVPGLAVSWRLSANGASGNTWIVTLRQNARFSDNAPVTATDVVSSWMSVGVGRGNGSELRPEVLRLVRSIVAVDDRTLEITFQSGRADAVLALAHTNLAIATPVPGSPWPLGTRDVRIDSTSSSVITLIRLPENVSIRFLVTPGRDGRDFLDQGVDLLLTRDPRTLDYAATLPQFQMAPLPWQRTHVLLTPGRVPVTSFSVEERQALARDSVRGPARGAEGPFWWESLSDCEGLGPQTPVLPPPATVRIVYDADDGAARELAERFVGIGKYPRANGLTGEALSQALRRGNESAYILSLDRRPLDPCREMQVLESNAGWIDPQTIVPLVDTRLQAIVRRGRSALTTDWDGVLIGK